MYAYRAPMPRSRISAKWAADTKSALIRSHWGGLGFPLEPSGPILFESFGDGIVPLRFGRGVRRPLFVCHRQILSVSPSLFRVKKQPSVSR